MKDSNDDLAADREDVSIEDEDGAEESTPHKRRLSGKKITLFIILPVLLLGGGGTGAYVSGYAEPLLAKIGLDLGAESEKALAPAVYYDLPEILVDLNSGGKQSSFLKLKVALEIESTQASRTLDIVLPRIIDSFQVYLRELRREDLSGSAGLFRLKEELLVRVNAAAKPVRVKDVLFKEMVVQ